MYNWGIRSRDSMMRKQAEKSSRAEAAVKLQRETACTCLCVCVCTCVPCLCIASRIPVKTSFVLITEQRTYNSWEIGNPFIQAETRFCSSDAAFTQICGDPDLRTRFFSSPRKKTAREMITPTEAAGRRHHFIFLLWLFGSVHKVRAGENKIMSSR